MDILTCDPPYRSRPGDSPWAALTTKRYTEELARLLWHRLGLGVRPRMEWHALTADERGWRVPYHAEGNRSYDQIVDLAVEPFAMYESLAEQYDALLHDHRDLVERLIEFHAANVRAFGSEYPAPDFYALREGNSNPRCFMAIEIERMNLAAKYLVGSALSAASWGKVGIVVCWPARLKSLLRIRETVTMQDRYSKNTFRTNNLLLLDCEQIAAALMPTP